MKLYELTGEFRRLLEHVDEDGELDPQILEDLGKVESNIEEKTKNIAFCIQNLWAEYEAVREARENMHERERKLEKRAMYLTGYLKDNLETAGIMKVTMPEFVVKIKKCQMSLWVEDERLINPDFFESKTVTTLNRAELKKKLGEGCEVEGAKLVQRTRLEIK